MKIPKNATNGDKYSPIAVVINKEEAKKYFEACVEHTMSFGKTREEAEDTERANIKYFSGYFSNEAMKRVHELFFGE